MKKLFTSLLISLCCICLNAQQTYFVDGYHGGIYGHYPVEWKTRFITDKLAEHPEWRICLEIEPETWDSVRSRTPEDYARFQKVATDSRVEFTNPSYAQPYCYNISGESIIRQFGYGIKKTREHFPGVQFTTYSAEEPCFTSSLPQILQQFGFKYAVLKCPDTCWGGYMAPYGGELVNWVGPDGTRMLTVPRYACEELEDNSVWQTKAWANSREYLDACLRAGIANPVGMCFQDAGWKKGPWIGSGEKIKNGSQYVTWQEYIGGVTKGSTDDDYRMSQEDVRVSLMWGSQVLQQIGRQVREAENKVIIAEKIGAMANIACGYRYPQNAMDEAWRTLMLAQHHDSWIVPYNRLNGKRTWAQEIERWTTATNTACDSVITMFQNCLATGDDKAAGASGNDEARTVGKTCYVRIYNTLGIQRREPVTVLLPRQFGMSKTGTKDYSINGNNTFEVYNANGKPVPSFAENAGEDGVKLVFDADVPPFGYSTYRIGQTAAAASTLQEQKTENSVISIGEYVMENDMYRIVIDASKGGTIKSLVAKQAGNKEFVDKQSEYSLGELRGFFPDEARFISSTEKPAEITVAKDNPFEKSVSISGHIGSHPFVQTITIHKGQRNIDFALRIDWQGNTNIGEFKQNDGFKNNRRAFYDDRFKLNVLFPVGLSSPVLFKDAPFDVCESKLENTHFKTWDSIKHNVMLHWVDLAERPEVAGKHAGFALLSDHTTSYSYGVDFPLGLTVQYSGGGLWGRNYGVKGPSDIRFAVIPHMREWDAAGIHDESLRWNEPLTYSIHADAKPESKSLIDVTDTGYEISAAYATDAGIVLRLFNAQGDASRQNVKFGFRIKKAYETDLEGKVIAEKKVRNKHDGCKIKVDMPRFGLKTLLLSK